MRLSSFRDTLASVPPAFTLILTAFTLTTNSLRQFVQGFCGEWQAVWAILWLGAGDWGGLPLLPGSAIFFLIDGVSNLKLYKLYSITAYKYFMSD